MTDGDNPLPFTIKPLSPLPASPPPPPPPAKRVGKKAAPKAADPPPAQPVVRTAGRFRSSHALLSFLGFAARLTSSAGCRRSPDGDLWWAEVELAWETIAEAVWTTGGRPFAWQSGGWVGVLPGGGPAAGATGPVPAAGSTDWVESGLADVLAGVPLTPGPIVTSDSCAVLAPGVLARWVIKRALGVGLTGTVRQVRVTPLGGGPAADRVLVRLSAARGAVPAALAAAVARLPEVVVATPAAGATGRLLVDVRCRSPLSGIDIEPMIPTNEAWVLGGADVGHSRAVADTPEMDLAGLLRSPGGPVEVPRLEVSAIAPSEVPVRLVRDPLRDASRADAVLVDDAQLELLRRFLPTRPAGEVGFLLPGPGRHLLTGAGGLPDHVPFGVPLARVGPGGLFVESGYGFEPPLPPGARRAAFGVGEGRTVAVTRDGSFAFDPANLVPAWALWLGPPPKVEEGLSADARRVLTGVSESIRRAERERAEREKGRPHRPATEDPGELRREAEVLLLAGRVLEAAAKLEQAGDFLRAARLFEQAAAEM